MKKIFKQNQLGITLIALIVTIIVLLILAWISISMIMENEGILGKTINAKNENNAAKIKEEIELAIASSRME